MGCLGAFIGGIAAFVFTEAVVAFTVWSNPKEPTAGSIGDIFIIVRKLGYGSPSSFLSFASALARVGPMLFCGIPVIAAIW